MEKEKLTAFEMVLEMTKLADELRQCGLTNLQEEVVQSIEHSLRVLNYELAD